MGEEAFGLLTLIWMVVGYFSILDLGVGQASVKFLAAQIAENELDKANSTVWVSVGVSAFVGVATSFIIVLLIPEILHSMITLPAVLQAETRRSFYWVTIAVPFVMLQGAFRAVPMAVQRFDLFNLVVGLSGLAQWGGSLVVVLLGMGLVEVVLLTVAIRVAGAVAAYAIAMRLLPALSFRSVSNVRATARSLLKFGGWLTVSQAVSPVARYLDRVFVASYHSLKMFTYYTVPFEGISRLQMIPVSLSSTLFPAMSERETLRGQAESFPLYTRAINFTILVMLPVSIGLIVFSQPLLQLWLGGDFPALSGGVFKILAAAVFVQAVCYIPITFLQAMGRPEMAAKYYLVEIPLYIGLCFLLIPSFGVEGAAWAYCIRMVLSTVWFFWITHRMLGFPPMLLTSIKRSLGLNFVLVFCLMLIAQTVEGLTGQLVALFCVAVGYLFAVWSYCLDNMERHVIQSIMFVRFRANS
jgi:O-antigen/teichoic acid export membrane protein